MASQPGSQKIAYQLPNNCQKIAQTIAKQLPKKGPWSFF